MPRSHRAGSGRHRGRRNARRRAVCEHARSLAVNAPAARAAPRSLARRRQRRRSSSSIPRRRQRRRHNCLQLRRQEKSGARARARRRRRCRCRRPGRARSPAPPRARRRRRRSPARPRARSSPRRPRPTRTRRRRTRRRAARRPRPPGAASTRRRSSAGPLPPWRPARTAGGAEHPPTRALGRSVRLAFCRRASDGHTAAPSLVSRKAPLKRRRAKPPANLRESFYTCSERPNERLGRDRL